MYKLCACPESSRTEKGIYREAHFILSDAGQQSLASQFYLILVKLNAVGVHNYRQRSFATWKHGTVHKLQQNQQFFRKMKILKQLKPAKVAINMSN
jgi:hypothetical protein